MSVDDKYTYPGSVGVLINEAGIRDHVQLDEAMNDVALFVLARIYTEPAPESLDLEYLRGIHVRMFGDLLPGIAGRIRDVDVQATGPGSRTAGPTSSRTTSPASTRTRSPSGWLIGGVSSPRSIPGATAIPAASPCSWPRSRSGLATRSTG